MWVMNYNTLNVQISGKLGAKMLIIMAYSLKTKSLSRSRCEQTQSLHWNLEKGQ